MYSGPLYRVQFKPEQRALLHREVREEYTKRLREQQSVSLQWTKMKIVV